MTSVILHLSDLHIGAGASLQQETLIDLQETVDRYNPEIIVASGDLTHRNLTSQHQEAAELLQSLGPPVLAVPGNHDIPALPPKRFTNTYEAFLNVWGETEPTYYSEKLTIVGLSSVQPWLYQEGLLTHKQIKKLENTLQKGANTTRVVVMHHHLASAPWRTAKKPLLRRSSLLKTLSRMGIDLVLAGHVHQTSIAAAAEFYTEASHDIIVSTTAGIGHPRPGRHTEVRGFQIWEIDARELRSHTFSWTKVGLRKTSHRSFPR